MGRKVRKARKVLVLNSFMPAQEKIPNIVQCKKHRTYLPVFALLMLLPVQAVGQPLVVWAGDGEKIDSVRLERALAAHAFTYKFVEEPALAVAASKGDKAIRPVIRSYRAQFSAVINVTSDQQVLLSLAHVSQHALSRNNIKLLKLPRRINNNFYRHLAIKVARRLDDFAKKYPPVSTEDAVLPPPPVGNSADERRLQGQAGATINSFANKNGPIASFYAGGRWVWKRWGLGVDLVHSLPATRTVTNIEGRMVLRQVFAVVSGHLAEFGPVQLELQAHIGATFSRVELEIPSSSIKDTSNDIVLTTIGQAVASYPMFKLMSVALGVGLTTHFNPVRYQDEIVENTMFRLQRFAPHFRLELQLHF